MIRLQIIAFNNALFHKNPILQSILNWLVMLVFLVLAIVLSIFYFLYYSIKTGPNKIWFCNIFLIINEICLLVIYTIVTIFAFYDAFGFIIYKFIIFIFK